MSQVVVSCAKRRFSVKMEHGVCNVRSLAINGAICMPHAIRGTTTTISPYSTLFCGNQEPVYTNAHGSWCLEHTNQAIVGAETMLFTHLGVFAYKPIKQTKQELITCIESKDSYDNRATK